MQNLKKNWHEKFGKFLSEHSKVSKLGLWWGLFTQYRKCMSLKFTEELCIMTIKNDAKFEEELTSRFKIDTANWQILTRALECLKNLHFDGLLLTKVYNVWANKVQKSYVWWHWKLIKISRRTDLCIQKWHKEFGRFS